MKYVLSFLFLFVLTGCGQKQPVVEHASAQVTSREGKLYQSANYSGRNSFLKTGVEVNTVVYSLQAELHAMESTASNANADAMIELLYQSPGSKLNENMIIARLYVRTSKGRNTLSASVLHVHDKQAYSYDKFSAIESPFNETLDISLSHIFKLVYDSERNIFIFSCDGTSQTLDPPEGFNPNHFKKARLAVCVNNFNKHNGDGQITAHWDNVYVNNELYDSFDTNTINADTWITFEKTR